MIGSSMRKTNSLRSSDMPFGIQPWHLIAIAFVALIVFGPSKLPEIGRTIGKTFNEFRNGAHEMSESMKEEINHSDIRQPYIAPPSTPAAYVPPPPAQSGEAGPVVTGNFCTQCGAPNLADARFCKNCGNRLQA
jgi:TatA/E family protein of Tat protein translocase